MENDILEVLVSSSSRKRSTHVGGQIKKSDRIAAAATVTKPSNANPLLLVLFSAQCADLLEGQLGALSKHLTLFR